MSYKIENVPLKPAGKGPTPHYPIRELQIGQSFLVPIGERAKVTAAVANVNKMWEMKISIRREGTDWIRVGRIA